MLGKSPHQQQTELFKNLLAHRLSPQHSLYLLARVIPWEKIEEAFAVLFVKDRLNTKRDYRKMHR
jgi:hypothetical protein